MKLVPVYAWTKGFRSLQIKRDAFLEQPWAQGFILLVCVVVAMLLANLPFTKHFYHSILETELSINILHSDKTIVFPHGMTVEKFINDILMVIFFFTVGLEIKREMLYGELASFKKAMLPIVAAIGGVVLPALIFFAINGGTLSHSGWGIPTATDIAFAVGILTVLNKKVPISLKVFLTALAIVDDLIAILVVAFFYGGNINLNLIGIALIIICILLLLKHLGEKRPAVYLVPAIVIWALFYYSGVHATMSGVVMAFIIPIDARYSRPYFNRHRRQVFQRLNDYDSVHESGGFPNTPQRECLRKISSIATDSIGLSYRLEHALLPWVSYIIMPIFALANAGVTISDPKYLNILHYDPQLGSVGLGIFLGLVLGKSIGITLASYLAIKFKIGEMPKGATWKMLFAVAFLGGIGFTMSIFVDTLSFGDCPDFTLQLRNMGKIAVLVGSIAAGLIGSILIIIFHKMESKK